MTEIKGNESLRGELDQLIADGDTGSVIMVSRRTLHAVLRRVLGREVKVNELVDWANLIEAHDQVEYEPGFEKLIADVVFSIASPEINEILTDISLNKLIDRLDL